MNWRKLTGVFLGAAFLAMSCQEEVSPSEETVHSLTRFTAVSDGIGVQTAAEMQYRYDVLWQDGDRICVVGDGTKAVFVLSGGAGTTVGTFEKESGDNVSGAVTAYYPAEAYEENAFVWPSEQTASTAAPMIAYKDLSAEPDGEFHFSGLGTVLRVAFSTSDEDVTLKTVRFEEEATSTDFTLDLGEGVALGVAANYFSLMLPSGSYTNPKLTFTAADGAVCEMTSDDFPKLEQNTVALLTLEGTFSKPVPPTPPVGDEVTATLTYEEINDQSGGYGNPFTHTNEYGDWTVCAYLDNKDIQLNSKKKVSYVGTPEFEGEILNVSLVLNKNFSGEINICSDDSGVNVISTESGDGGKSLSIDLEEYHIRQFYLRSEGAVNILEIAVTYGSSAPEPVVDDAFTRISVPGIYNLSNPDSPVSVFVAGDGEQVVYGTKSASRSWNVLNPAGNWALMLTLGAKTLSTGNSVNALVSTFGTVPVSVSGGNWTVHAKSGKTVWLKDAAGTTGYIINIE